MANLTANSLILDVGGVAASADLHERIASALHLPDYYGRNWDAFEECIRHDLPVPALITVQGLEALRQTLPRDAALLIQCLSDAEAQSRGKLTVAII